MIKIELKNNYKSLTPFEIELPDFVILTGLNGAGKTQILNALNGNIALLLDENNIQLNPKKYVTSNTLSPNNISAITREQLNSNTKALWDAFNQSKFRNNPQIRPRPQNNIISLNSDQSKLIDQIVKSANKEISELNVEDFYNYYPLNDGLNLDIFHQNFSTLFKRYQDKLEENDYKKFKNESKGDKSSKYLSDEDFLKKYGEPPWLFVNSILHEANLDYCIEIPEDYNRDAPYIIKLVNTFSKVPINISDLSSGEKVLMSLALALYNSSFDIQFPKVLLMDEPDASLHPSMSKKFLDVVKEIFVNQKGVKVIMTTHSASTVALADDENLYVVNKTGNRIEKANKDYALGILTSGVPSFSVNFENRRQVFVESENDVKFYEKIYKKIKHLLNPEISLTFISSGETRTDKNGQKISNCGQVVNVTSVLREAGNNFVWGIIDWDTENSSEGYIKVLGDGNRYSIESYLFDPTLLAALLLREKIVSRNDLGLNENLNYSDFKNLSQDKIQKIANFVIEILAQQFDTSKNELISVKYLNEIEIKLPKWYIQNNGHELEEKILKVFPQLNSIKKGKEENLKLEIIDKVIDDIPEFIPFDILDAFLYIQQ